MSLLDTLESAYKAPEVVTVIVPMVNQPDNKLEMYFKGIQSVQARKLLEEAARKWAKTNAIKNLGKKVGVTGDDAEDWLRKAYLLAETSTGDSTEENAKLTPNDAIRLLAMPELFNLIYSLWENGQRTINNALIEIYIEESKKKSAESTDLSQQESETQEAPEN